MPVTYQIDKGNRMIRTKCKGPVSIEEVIDHFRTLEQDPECAERLDVLLEVSRRRHRKNRINKQSLVQFAGFEAGFSSAPALS
jgi:hypothetical protein